MSTSEVLVDVLYEYWPLFVILLFVYIYCNYSSISGGRISDIEAPPLPKRDFNKQCDILNDSYGGDWYLDLESSSDSEYVYKDFMTDREVWIKR